jgi:hypothetical protein
LVTELSARSDGSGVISIRIGKNAYVKTYPNRFADRGSGTIVQPGSAAHAQTLGLRVGQPVAFSGTFFPDEKDCVRESSITTGGSMTKPEFIMRFTDLSAPPPVQTEWLSKVQEPADQAKSSRALAEQGNPEAQNKLGLMYVNGEGVSRDHAEAIKWFRRAASQEHAGGQFNLGKMYAEGLGVAQSLIRAYMWINLSAQARYAAALVEKARIAALISIAQLEAAEEMAKRCRETNYKQCDEPRDDIATKTKKKNEAKKPTSERKSKKSASAGGCGSRGGAGYRLPSGKCASRSR